MKVIARIATSPASLDNPEAILAVLETLPGPEEFWLTIRNWVSADHVRRRRAYYDARFRRERIEPQRQLSWLARDFYSDIAQTDYLRSTTDHLPLAECPFASRVEFDEFLATITSLDNWPDAPSDIFRDEDYDTVADLVDMGIMPTAIGLDSLKRWSRSHLNANYFPPVLPIS